jgi:hypothetical protein
MIYELLIALIAISLILSLLMELIIFQIYKKNKANIEKLALTLQIVYLSCIFLYFLTLLFPLLPIYQALLVPTTSGFFLTVYAFFVLLSGSGEIRPKRERNLLLLLVGIINVILLVLSFLNIKTDYIEEHLYFGLAYPVLIGPAIFILIPIIYMVTISFKKLLKLYEQRFQLALTIFIITLFIYVMSQYFTFFLMEARILSVCLLVASCIIGVYFFKKDPNFLVRIGTSFAFKSIFLIKNNGQTIYSHEFQPMLSQTTDKKTINYLIGGFIYALSHGIKEIVKHDYGSSLRSMDFGTFKMLFYYTDQLFGVLFATTSNNIMHNKLKNFVDAFQQTFPDFVSAQDYTMLLEEQPGDEKNKEAVEKIKALLKLHFKW